MSNYVTNCIWGAQNLFVPSLLFTVSGWTLFFWRSIQINVTETHNAHHVTHLFEKCWCKHDACKEGCTIVEKKRKITIFFRNQYLLQLLPVTKEQNQKDIIVLCARLAHRDERIRARRRRKEIFQEGCRMCRSRNLRSKVDVNRKLVPH